MVPFYIMLSEMYFSKLNCITACQALAVFLYSELIPKWVMLNLRCIVLACASGIALVNNENISFTWLGMVESKRKKVCTVPAISWRVTRFGFKHGCICPLRKLFNISFSCCPSSCHNGKDHSDVCFPPYSSCGAHKRMIHEMKDP